MNKEEFEKAKSVRVGDWISVTGTIVRRPPGKGRDKKRNNSVQVVCALDEEDEEEDKELEDEPSVCLNQEASTPSSKSIK